MKTYTKSLQLFCLVSLTMVSYYQPAFAQSMTCEQAIDLAPSAHYEALRDVVVREFGIQLNEPTLKRIDQQINSLEAITIASKEDFQQFLLALQGKNIVQEKEATALLGRPLKPIQMVALRLTRALGRTERGADPELFAFSGNYRADQIERKDRILELADFTYEERFALFGNRTVEDVITKFAPENLFYDHNARTPEDSVKMSNAVINVANAENPPNAPKNEGKRLHSLDADKVNDLYETVTRHPVVRLLRALKYDPKGIIGFCFGRAFVGHIEALRLGVDKESVRKVFVVGEMKAILGNTTWRYHVALAVKAADGGWWVVDPFIGKPIKLEPWFDKMKSHDIGGNLQLYMTEASRFGPGQSARYNKVELLLGVYNNYFVDVLKHFRLKAKNQEPKKAIWTKAFDKLLSIVNLGF